MKKLLLIPALSMHSMAGGNLTYTHTQNAEDTVDNTIGTQKRTYFEIAMGKPGKPLTDEELRTRVLYTNLIGAGLVATGTLFGITLPSNLLLKMKDGLVKSYTHNTFSFLFHFKNR